MVTVTVQGPLPAMLSPPTDAHGGEPVATLMLDEVGVDQPAGIVSRTSELALKSFPLGAVKVNRRAPGTDDPAAPVVGATVIVPSPSVAAPAAMTYGPTKG